MSVAGSAGCASCGGRPADMHLGATGPLCDRCFDDYIAHTMIYRLSRGPAGISARLVEQDPPPDGGYEFAEFGGHDTDPKVLLDLVTVRADNEMARRSLSRTGSGGWEIRHDEGRLADEVVGRIETVGPFGPLTLVVDGHAVRWDESLRSKSPPADTAT